MSWFVFADPPDYDDDTPHMGYTRNYTPEEIAKQKKELEESEKETEAGERLISLIMILGFIECLGLTCLISKCSNAHTTQKHNISYPVKSVEWVRESHDGTHLEAQYFENGIERTLYWGGHPDKISRMDTLSSISEPEVSLDSTCTYKTDPSEKIRHFTLRLPQGYVIRRVER